MTRFVLGIGCDAGTCLLTVERAVREALAAAGVAPEAVTAVASIALKRHEPALWHLAARQGWPLRFYPAPVLAQVPVPHPSETVRRHTGTPAVAEAAALWCAGGGHAELRMEKMRWRGEDGRHATISIARLLDEE